VALGFASASFAASLATTLYGTYKWYFRAAGLMLLAISLISYFRRQKGICTIDEAVQHKNEIINTVALALITGILGYLFFLYVVVEYAGIILKIWE
jgi:predicted exporter